MSEEGSLRRGEAFAKNNHPKTNESDFRTPDYLLHWVSSTWGRITHDGACSTENSIATAFDLFGQERLQGGDVLFVNPPWETNEVMRFVEASSKQVTNGATVIFLLPNKLCEVKWVDCINIWFEYIFLLGGRVDFSGPHSVKKGATRWGTIVTQIRAFPDHHATTEWVTLRELKKDANG